MTEQQAETKPESGAKQPRRLVVKALAIGLDEPVKAGQSNVDIEDPVLKEYVAKGMVIDPPFDPLVLSMLVENSTVLEQCISTMEINIDGFGYKFVRRVNTDSPNCPEALKQAVATEAIFLENLFTHFCLDYSFTGFRRRVRRDEELTGNAFFEVVANASGQIDQLVHVPSYQMRLSPIDEVATPFQQKRLVRKEDGSVDLETVTAYKRFRRIVQFARLGTDGVVRMAYDKPVWFKEWGDPRPISKVDGKVLTEAEAEEAKDKKILATPMVHFKLYSARSPYGVPRYVGNLITLFGDREADNVNFVTLSSNNIPSMILAVSNGSLTQGSIDRIKQFTQEQIAGSRNRTRFLLIEAENPYQQEGTGDLSGGAPKLDVKPLTNSQIQDQLFQSFGENNRKKIREAWRLPPIFVGDATQYNRATAEASRKLADEQVFAPERAEFDSWMNRELLPSLGVKFHKFLSQGPNVTDDEDLIRVLVAAEKTGGMTPRIARWIIEDIMGREFPETWKDFDPDVPLTLQLAERMKNTGAAGSNLGPAGIDVSQTVKSLTQTEPEAAALLEGLFQLREKMEAELTRRGEA